MPRTGVEEKPPWRDLPAPVRAAVEEALGGRVERGMRVWGGYGPTPTYRLRLANGERVFLKAVGPGSTEFIREAYAREERVYREIGGLIAGFAPAFRGSIQRDGWQVLALEDLGPQTVPPWSPTVARRIMHAYADFHRATLDEPLPAWLPRPTEYLDRQGRRWTWATDGEDASIAQVAALAGRRARAAARWLEEAAAVFATFSPDLAAPDLPNALLHGDTRSDNMRWTGGRLYLVDWPHATVGPPEDDLTLFVQSVTLESGLEPELLVSWYAERAPVHPRALDAALAAMAGFFAYQAWRPDIPGLPRLRRFQRQQLCITLAWAARHFGLTEPAWLEAVDRE